MGLFGARKPCGNCGKNVKEPSDEAGFLCPRCGRPGPWASAEQVSDWEGAQKMRADFFASLEAIGLKPNPVPSPEKLEALAQAGGLSPLEVASSKTRSMVRVAELALADGVIDPTEARRLMEVQGVLAVAPQDLEKESPGLAARAAAAEIQGGRLPQLTSHRLIAKRDEIVHLEVQAALMKEVALREYRAGFSGLSIPLGKGFRYRIGAMRVARFRSEQRCRSRTKVCCRSAASG